MYTSSVASKDAAGTYSIDEKYVYCFLLCVLMILLLLLEIGFAIMCSNFYSLIANLYKDINTHRLSCAALLAIMYCLILSAGRVGIVGVILAITVMIAIDDWYRCVFLLKCIFYTILNLFKCLSHLVSCIVCGIFNVISICNFIMYVDEVWFHWRYISRKSEQIRCEIEASLY